MAPLELRAYQAQQQLNAVRDASQWKDQGLFGALGRTLAAAQAPAASQDAVQQIVQQRLAAAPDLAKMLSAPQGAAAYVAANPNISPLAKMLATNQTPLEGAQGQQLAIANQLGALNLAGFQRAQPGASVSTPVARTNGGIAALGASGQPGAAAAVPTPQRAAPTAASPIAPTQEMIEGAAKLPDPPTLAQLLKTPADRAKFLAGLPPGVREAYKNRFPMGGATP